MPLRNRCVLSVLVIPWVFLLLGGCERSPSVEDVWREEIVKKLTERLAEGKKAARERRLDRAVTLLRAALDISVPPALETEETIRRMRLDCAISLGALYLPRRSFGRAEKLYGRADAWAKTNEERSALLFSRLALFLDKGDGEAFDKLAARARPPDGDRESFKVRMNLLHARRELYAGRLMDARQYIEQIDLPTPPALLTAAEVMRLVGSRKEIRTALGLLNGLVNPDVGKLGPDPSNNAALVVKAEILLGQEKFVPAKKNLDQALANRKGDPVMTDLRLLGLSGWTLSALGNRQGAQKNFAEARRALPDFTGDDRHAEGLVDYYEGRAAVVRGEKAEAARLLGDARRKLVHPSARAEAAFFLGKVFRDLEEEQAAAKEFRFVRDWCGYCALGRGAAGLLGGISGAGSPSER